VTVILGIENIVLQAVFVFSQSSNVMGLNKPFLVVICLWNYFLDFFVILLSWQHHFVACSDVVIH